MSLIRKNITKLVPYQPGKPIEELKRELGLGNIVKLASNENPFGCGKQVATAIKKAISQINRYPEGSCYYLRQALSHKLKLRPEMFLFGNGSDELIDIIIKTFVEQDENIITAEVTFLEYRIIAEILGRRVIRVALRDFCYDLKSILKKINKKTKVIFIANPNNPTGTYVSSSELDDFIKKVPKRIVIVLDEAYDAFIDVKDFPDSRRYLNQKDNMIILKTFSKAYGLAGLRIGYALANEKIVSCMERVRMPFNVNLLAQAGAAAALDDELYIERIKKEVLAGKDYFVKQLSVLGLKFIPSVANFILIDTGRDGQEIYRDMLNYGVIIRDMRQYGLKNFIRVTIGTKSENKRFIQVLKKIL